MTFISILIFSFLLSGYGYMGELPELGKSTREIQKTLPVSPVQKPYQVNPTQIIAPRVSTGYNINKYSNYLADIKEVEQLLKEIRTILEDNNQEDIKNRVQLYNAKTFVLGLYVDVFKDKYNDRPEHYYESYKQLVSLNQYLKNTDEQNPQAAIVPINTVIGIIDDTE